MNGQGVHDAACGPVDYAFVAMSAGNSHACGLCSDASITCWGDNRYGQARPPGGSFTAISAGTVHSCGLRSDATVVCWGAVATDLRGDNDT